MMNNGIVVVSTFDGMGCLYSALKRARIKVKKYFAYEIDKYAMQAAKALHPGIIHLGDITKASVKDFAGLKIDLLAGGSPCQGFSFAGKQLAFDDPRSKLFFEFVRLKNEIQKVNPDLKFLLENVNMKKNELRIISEYLGVFPVNINSNLVSAQNRNRWYWSNIKTKDVGLFAENWVDIPQPQDKGILLKDILQPESEINEKYYLSDKMISWLNKHSLKRETEIKQLDGNQKAGCLTATAQTKQNLTTDYIAVGAVKFGRTDEAKEIRKQNMKKGKDHTPFAKKEVIGIDYDKMGAVLTGTNKDNLLTDGYKLRRLTPTECLRLQTFSEYEIEILLNAGISDTQLYKMAGNGWTIDVIAYILSYFK